MKNILITGITGFAGSFLAEYLKSKNKFNIYGTYLFDESLSYTSGIIEQKFLTKIDLTNFEDVSKLVKKTNPDYIFHLAAMAFPSLSYKDPGVTMYTNINAQLNILETVRRNNIKCSKILIISSGEIYGPAKPDNLPMSEKNELLPVSPYSVSKIAQDYLGLQYFLSYNLPVIRARPFNHLGPKLSPNLAPSAFAKKIAEIEKGIRKPVIDVGDLSAKRDYTDVRDIVKAYFLLAEKGLAGEAYNIGSGVSYKISDILNILLSFSKVKIKVETNQDLLRPNNVPELLCDYTKLTKATGWKPKIPIKESLKDILDYWRGII